MKRIKLISPLLSCAVFTVAAAVTLSRPFLPARAADLGVFGQTYGIKEKNILEVVKERASGVDWKEIMAKAETDLRAKAGRIDKGIPRAMDNVTRYIDLTTSLERDIYTRDRLGTPRLLYPKGYRFNVLDYARITTRFVFFDAARPEEVAWFEREYASDLSAMPVITSGAALELSDEIGREVYLIDDEIISKLKISATPTVVYQEKNLLRADEIRLEADK